MLNSVQCHDTLSPIFASSALAKPTIVNISCMKLWSSERDSKLVQIRKISVPVQLDTYKKCRKSYNYYVSIRKYFFQYNFVIEEK